MSYLFLLLSSACSLTLVHLLKITEVKQLRTVNTLTINYLAAGVFALAVGWDESAVFTVSGELNYALLLFSVITGGLFIGNFFVFSKSVHTNGVGISIAAMRLSLLVPVVISIISYDEFLTPVKLVGVGLVLGSLILLVPKKETVRLGNINAGWLLVIIFVLSGFADASLKIYKEEFSIRLNELLFMSIVFAGAFGIGLFTCMIRNSRQPLFTLEELKLGVLIGIPNLYSSVFLIYALDGISGAIAFPLVNILNVIGGTLLGLYRWKDHLTSFQWTGIAIAVVAIILLL